MGIKKLLSRSLKGTGREEIQLDRLGKLVKNPNGSIPQHLYVSFPTVLEYLWDRVVKPVLNGLGIQSGSADDLPRIWWCPSGPLAILPLHAAGHYRNPTDDNIMDYVVSSYIPSASVTSQITRAEDTTPSFRLLAVANPAGCRLPGTQQDLHAIRKYVVNGPLTELVEESATPEAVKDELKSATWVHFACHGVQNRLLPTENSLILANHARLTLLDIIQLSLPKAQFAFLSACQTATGTLLGTDESAHLTAGMLLAGYRSVVGSMWNISDDYAPDFADRFYGRMFDGTQRPDYRRSAFALHDAVKMLRRDMNLGFRVWVPFIHVGA
ncbi:hypothetical protein BDN72DRAFT_778386 [Pluteus cervinus]|uniref:Uncharacterized protein n=1 Tax=Pluteus cervinus TaxID=181527 RepID=A0ACD3A7C7_9AGAR|nr:hypothetical protein BDN72DRAFT_778386 [Pluteus cervinus]